MSLYKPIIGANEQILYQTLKRIFPNTQIFSNVTKDLNIKYPLTNGYMEFDIWMPEYHLCFEFQDPYHYVTTWYYQNTQQHIQYKDNIKAVSARKKGLHLVSIPYWWDGSIKMLEGSIHFQRPDLLVSEQLITLNPTLHHVGAVEIPGVGELMAPAFPVRTFDIPFNDTTWWVGEKYDGIRCCWNPELLAAYTRYGKQLPLLESVTRLFPVSFTDSELWFGRGQFLDTCVAIRSVDHRHWPMLRIVTFDVPSFESRAVPFELRYKRLLQNITSDHPFNLVVPRIKVHNNLNWLVRQAIEAGGEGVILQKRASPYVTGRSLSLVKLKSTQNDQEAIVIGLGDNKSVILKLPNGATFTVPEAHVHISTPPVGAIVTITYSSKQRVDVPTDATIHRLRPDLQWPEVCHSFYSSSTLNETSPVKGFTTLPVGYWTKKNMRVHMENFARERNTDPLNPETWKNSYAAFLNSKYGKKILRKFKYRYYDAIKQLFPEIKVDQSFQANIWSKFENRRMFFERYATLKGFDCQQADNWYMHSAKIMTLKGAQRILHYHNNSISNALEDLFPNIGIDKSKFPAGKSLWSFSENRRAFFEGYANNHRFDSLIPDNWYKESRERIISTKDARMVMSYHSNSIPKALVDLFPNIGLDIDKFQVRQLLWRKEENRRMFFEHFAKDNNFDPLVPANWYAVSRDRILATKGARVVISYHKDTITNTLLDLFPNIGLEKAKLVDRGKWDTEDKRRNFFVEYAKANSFDLFDVNKWYSQSMVKVLAVKGARLVLSYYEDSLATALVTLYPHVGFKKAKFRGRQILWRKMENRKLFFINYASENKFDPKIAASWNQQSKSSIMAVRGASAVLSYHGNSLARALSELFSDHIQLEDLKFQ